MGPETATKGLRPAAAALRVEALKTGTAVRQDDGAGS